MTKFPSIAAALVIGLAISACSGNDAPDGNEVTETQMDEVDVIDGTISDEMVDIDTIQEVDTTGADGEAASDGDIETKSEDEAATDNPAE